MYDTVEMQLPLGQTLVDKPCYTKGSFGEKSAFMGSVCETSEFVIGLKNPTFWHVTICTEPS